MKKNNYIYSFPALLFLIILFIIFNPYYEYTHRVLESNRNLQILKEFIVNIKSVKKKYPSIYEINAFVYARSTPVCEYISSGRGICDIDMYKHNNGGWSYDVNTGNVQIDLNKQLSHYMFFYMGKLRETIPSEW